MYKIKSIVILIITVFSLCVAIDAYSQAAIVKKAIKPIAKVVSKKSAKKGAINAARHQSYTLPLMKSTAMATIKSKGMKSFLEYSSSESSRILKAGISGKKISSIRDYYKKQRIDANQLIRNAGAHSSQKLTRTASKLANLPKGKESLKVRWAGKKEGYVPVVNNSKTDAAFNRMLLAERRNSINPHNQFPTVKQLSSYDAAIMEVGKKPSAAVLKRNMLKVMDEENSKIINAFGGAEAHHVIPGTDKAAQASRNILKKFEIDINSPENGIFLPSDVNSIYKGTVHKTGHTPMYSKYCYTKLKNCKKKEEVINALQGLKKELYTGKLTLEGNKSLVNKNIKVVESSLDKGKAISKS